MSKQKKKKKTIFVDAEEEERSHLDSNLMRTFNDFNQLSISIKHKHLRSKYFHNLNLLIEPLIKKYNEIGNIDFDEKQAYELSKKLKLFSFQRRGETNIKYKLDPRHTKVLLMLRSRLDYLLSAYNKSLNQLEMEDLKAEELQDFLLPEKERIIGKQSVYSFWRSVNLIYNSFYCLRYTKILERYIQRLWNRCGFFMCVRSTSGMILNDPLFCVVDSKRIYHNINFDFIENCDWYFHQVQMMFEMYNELVHYNLKNPDEDIIYPISKRRDLLNWMFKEVSGSFLQATEQMMQTWIFDVYLNPGEKERFKSEERHSDPTPFNIITKYRRGKFDELSDIFELKTPLETIVKRYLDAFDKIENEEKKKIQQQDENTNKSKKEEEEEKKNQGKEEEEEEVNVFDTLVFLNQSNHAIFVEEELKKKRFISMEK